MPKKLKNHRSDDLRSEYDLETLFKSGERGKYANRYKLGTNLVLLDSDVARAFPKAEQVNDALRLVLKLTRIPSAKKVRSTQL
jgi:hypothetical protein